MILPDMSLHWAENGFSFSAAVCETIIKGLTNGKALEKATMIFFFVIFTDLESRILAVKQFLVDFEHEVVLILSMYFY